LLDHQKLQWAGFFNQLDILRRGAAISVTKDVERDKRNLKSMVAFTSFSVSVKNATGRGGLMVFDRRQSVEADPEATSYSDFESKDH
jgi:hypothetical protein